MHGHVSLHRDGHRHEDRSGHRDDVPRVQQVGEQQGLQVGLDVEALSQGLQDRPEQVEGVEAAEADEEEVEAVPHLTAGQDQAAHDVEQDSWGLERCMGELVTRKFDALTSGGTLLGGFIRLLGGISLMNKERSVIPHSLESLLTGTAE